MKLPFRFEKLSQSEIDEILGYLNVFGRTDGPSQTEKYTMFFLYPCSEHCEKGLKEYLENVFCFMGFRDKLIKGLTV